VRFIDSHAHLADPAFDADRAEVIERARIAGAARIIAIGESLDAAERARKIAFLYPGLIRYTAGVHPHEAATFNRDRDLPRLTSLVAAGAVAIGECGLDYHYDNAPRDVQREVFSTQIALAGKLKLPLIVHTRDAEEDTIGMISDAGAVGVVGVLHCFTGSPELARAAIYAGWYISFSGIITFRKWTDNDVLKLIPDDRLLAESDAPYLAPVPRRGKRNEPAWVSFTVARLAEVRGVTAERLGEQITRNAERFFGLANAVS
jgi:TatD DNase family protein